MLTVWLLLIGVIPSVAYATAPTAADVYAATQKSTTASPQSALVVLEGSDIDFDTLTYRIESGPNNGSLSDPANADAAVTTGNIAGQSVTYTPNDGFTGTDTFTYRVNDGNTDSAIQTASITVFEAWRENQRQLGADIDGEAANNGSGGAVALSSNGQIAAIGARNNNDSGGSAGQVRVYHYNGSAWVQLGADIDGEAAFDISGTSVALSSDGLTVAIGAPSNGGNGTSAGHVRVYHFDGSDWVQLGADIDGEAAFDQSGTSVALSSDGQTVAIGATGNDGNGSSSGHVRVYHFNGSAWTQRGADIDGEAANDRSGTSVALSGDGLTVAIGTRENSGNGSESGQVRVYHFSGSTWTQLGADIDGEASDDQSGVSVALSRDGLTVAIGAAGNDGTGTDAGQVRVFHYTGSTWVQRGADIDGEAAGDGSGTSVSLSSDGLTVAIGATGNGGNGSSSGHVRVYQFNGNVWVQQGLDMDGEAAGDQSGVSVALSSDGQTVVIGAAFNDGTGINAGHVRVYDLSDNATVFSGDTTGTGSEDGAAITGTIAATEEDSLAANDSYSMAVDPANGAASIAADGSWQYTPNPNFNGVDSFTITVTDSQGTTLSQVITVTVTAQNDTPTAMQVHAATQKNTLASPQSALVVLEGSDIDFDTLTYRIESGPNNGSLSDPANADAAVTTGDIAGQSVTYTPNDGFTGTDTFTYRVNDGNTDSAIQTASITVFEAWRENQRQLGADIDGEADFDQSGDSVALSSDGLTVAIGAPFNEGTGADAGQVRVYHFNGSVWAQRGLDIDGEAAGDQFGLSVALSSDGLTVAIGAPSNGGNGTSAGHVRVYHFDGSDWVQLGADIDGEADFDIAGTSVALSSDGLTVAIGAILNDGNGSGAGHVRVYHFNGSVWAQRGLDIDGEATSDQSGFSVALSSDGLTVAIGALFNGGNGIAAGHVRVYHFDGAAWTQRGTDIDGEATGDQSGFSVALSSDGQTVAIGARGRGAGHVRVYHFNGSVWAQRGWDIDGEATGDLSGSSVALSSDGLTVAIGAPFNDGTGSNAGQVRVYHFDGSAWGQLGLDIDGEAVSDESGTSVALSSDGQTVAIGANFNRGSSNSKAGHVRVYDLTNDATVFSGDTGGSGSEDGAAITGTIAAGDEDGLAANAPYSVTVEPANGAASIAADGSWQYTPNPNFNGVDSFTITVTDSQGNTASQVITVTVTAQNDTPTALEVHAATQKNTAASPQSALVVLQGTDFEWDPLTYHIVSGPNNGSLSDPANTNAAVTTGALAGQSVTYTPNDGFTGTDIFTYRVNDGNTDSPIQTATITVFDAWRENQRQMGADIDGEATLDRSGTSVALSSDGQTVAIGAPLNDDSGNNAGHVRVYHLNGNIWTQQGLDIDGEAEGDQAGTSVALSSDGQTLAIGAILNDGSGNNAGHVRVYHFDGSAWVQLGADIDGEAAFDFSGISVALADDGQTLAIGATVNGGNGSSAGHVRVYYFNGSAWTQRGADIDGEARHDRSGTSVALSGDGQTVAIGARDNGGNGSESGQVRVYHFSGSTWTQLGADIDGEAGDDQSGVSVALSRDGLTVAIGAAGNDGTGTDAGQVRVFLYTGSTWVQRGADIDGEAAGDRSGSSVALSSDGLTVAIGAIENGDTGADAGQVRVFHFNGSAWVQQGLDIDGEAAGDQSGTSVALSGDGQTVAIAARFNDGTDIDAGHVRVFRLGNTAPVITGTAATAITGVPYLFTPGATDADGELFMFSITNKPSWASFNTATGALSGTPQAGDVGVTSSVVITVTDTGGLSTDLGAFNLAVQLDQDTDGDGLGDQVDECVNTPLLENELVNGVGCGPSERDTDGDGTNDAQDAFPNNPEEQLDSDGDGYGDNEEAEFGSDPNDADDEPISPGLPIWLLYEAIK